MAIGDQEVTVDMLTELDRMVQLLESPIFTFVRMEVSQGRFSQSTVCRLNCFSFLTETPSTRRPRVGVGHVGAPHVAPAERRIPPSEGQTGLRSSDVQTGRRT